MSEPQGVADAADAFRRFVAIVKALRTPGSGCPWDLEQDHRSLRRYLLEETYETLDALDRESDPELREELGLELDLRALIPSHSSAQRLHRDEPRRQSSPVRKRIYNAQLSCSDGAIAPIPTAGDSPPAAAVY